MEIGYIDFYGYNKDTYEKLTEDFRKCLAEETFNTILDKKEPYYQSWGRCERVIWVKGTERGVQFHKNIEKRMGDMGYVRHTDYNLYDHSVKDVTHFKMEDPFSRN